MCDKCLELQRELTIIRNAIARENVGLEYSHPDVAAVYSRVVERLDRIPGVRPTRVFYRGVSWAPTSLPMPIW